MPEHFRPAAFRDLTVSVRRANRVAEVRARAYEFIGTRGDAAFARWSDELGWEQ